jgi:hypothetical protein
VNPSVAKCWKRDIDICNFVPFFFLSLSFSWVFVAQIGVRCEDEDVAELVMSCIA